MSLARLVFVLRLMSSLALCTRFLVVTGGSVTGRISRRMVAEAKLYVMMMLMVGMW